MGWELRTRYNPATDNTDGMLIRRDQWQAHNADLVYVKRLDLVRRPSNEVIPDEDITFAQQDWQNKGVSVDEFLQAMLEEAWKRGMRPKGFTDVAAGELKAQSAHLEDMRRLAFREVAALTEEAR